MVLDSYQNWLEVRYHCPPSECSARDNHIMVYQVYKNFFIHFISVSHSPIFALSMGHSCSPSVPIHFRG